MSKAPSGRSIIDATSAVDGESEEPLALRPRSQPVARVGAGVIGATQRTLSASVMKRPPLEVLVMVLAAALSSSLL